MSKQISILAIFATFGLLSSVLARAVADELPPADAKPLSEILKQVEDRDLGRICEAEFDDGAWEVKVCSDAGCQKLYLDPRTGEERRRRATRVDERPPANARAVSVIVRSVEAQKLGVITEVEFEYGRWELKVRAADRKIKLYLDPRADDAKQ